jgi:hypothetical protein
MKNFWPFFARILANLVNFDVKMFGPGDFDVEIARIWKQVIRNFALLFDIKILKNFHQLYLRIYVG